MDGTRITHMPQSALLAGTSFAESVLMGRRRVGRTRALKIKAVAMASLSEGAN